MDEEFSYAMEEPTSADFSYSSSFFKKIMFMHVMNDNLQTRHIWFARTHRLAGGNLSFFHIFCYGVCALSCEVKICGFRDGKENNQMGNEAINTRNNGALKHNVPALSGLVKFLNYFSLCNLPTLFVSRALRLHFLCGFSYANTARKTSFKDFSLPNQPQEAQCGEAFILSANP